MDNKNILILFYKYPEKGKVKTRLAQSVGEQQALEIYTCMIADLHSTAAKVPVSKITASTQPGEALTEKSIYDTFFQEGADLGEKMLNAFRRVFLLGCSKALLTGGDCPEVTAELFENAFEALSDHDYVIGPAIDGGYYLIGMKKEVCSSSVFTGIPWSTSRVLDATTEKLNAEKYTYKFIKKLNDIDTLEDAENFLKIHREDRDSETIKYLSGMRKDNYEI